MGSLYLDLMGFLQIVVPILLLLLISTIFFLNIKEIKEWRQANKQQVLTINAMVNKKRFQIIHHLHQFEIHLYYPSSNFYFVTFELENGENLELEINRKEYEQLSEGEAGKLIYQGKIFLQFISYKKE